MTPRFRPLLFVAVGCLAALVHWGVVVTLVDRVGWAPPAANVPGWLVAFLVSFSGHLRLTFRDAASPWWRAARRFFLVSATGFAINQSAYVLLLKLGGLNYRLSLALVLAGVAALTYWASRRWAFARMSTLPPTDPPATA